MSIPDGPIEQTISFSETSAPVLNRDFETRFEESFSRRAAKWLLTAFGLLLSFVFGFILSGMWEMHSKVYETIGRQESQKTIIESMISDKKELEKNNRELQQQILDLKLQQISKSINGRSK